jgi:HEAT repeat protein
MYAALLKELTGAFAANRAVVSKVLREIHERDPDGFASSAAEVLRESVDGPGAQFMLAILLRQTDSLKILCSAEMFTVEQSDALLRQAKALDPQAEVKLAKLVSKLPYQTGAQADFGTRLLAVLERSTDPETTMPALRQLLHSPSARVRSKAVLLIGRIIHNTQWAKLDDPQHDARVSANAIESLWGLDTSSAKAAFRDATSDPRPRVACNAAIGLYRAGDMEGATELFRLSRKEQPAFRAGAAWGMAYSGDPRFLPRLATLEEDTRAAVRRAAVPASARIRENRRRLEEAGSVPLRIETAQRRGDEHDLLVQVADGGRQTRGIRALELVVWNGDALVERFRMREISHTPPVVYQLGFTAPPAESQLVKVELYTERGVGRDTATEEAS